MNVIEKIRKLKEELMDLNSQILTIESNLSRLYSALSAIEEKEGDKKTEV